MIRMKTLKFLVNVSDKYTREEYKKGQIKEFEDERAKEILKAKQSNGQPYAIIIEEIETANKKIEAETAVKKTRKKKQ